MNRKQRRQATFKRAALSAPATTTPEPFAYTTGTYGGHFTLEPMNPAITIPKGFALYLHPPATAPERKPMHEGEIQAAWLGQDLDEPIPYSFVLGIRSAERFNGIKETP